jgi:hypothetical protein
MTPTTLTVPALVAQLRGTWGAMADCDKALAQRAQGQPACPWFNTLPGAGAVLAPRLLVACGAQRERYPSAEERQQYAGMAPGTARSGKPFWGHWRFQCPKFLRQTFVAWAAEALRHAFGARVDDQQPRDKGTAQQGAVRALAFQGIRILSRGWQERTPSDAAV